MTPGPVLLRRNVRHSKYEPLVGEVTLLEGNSAYAHIRLPNGWETTVSTRHLAPTGELHEDSIEAGGDESLPATGDAENLQELQSETAIAPQPAIEPAPPVLRRSEWTRHRPAYLEDYSVLVG